MKDIFDEYGSVIVGTVAAALILLLVIKFAFGGDIYRVILEFSKSIC